MFERLNRSYDDSEVTSAARIALELETDESLDACAKAFGLRASELDASEPRLSELLGADTLACELQLGSEDTQATWGAPLGPKLTFEDGSAYPPHLADWPDSIRPYFERRAQDTAVLELRARYNDLLWARWRQFPAARAAHQAYLELGTRRGFADALSTARGIHELNRATTLSQSLGIERETTAAAVITLVAQGLAADKFHAADLITETSSRLLTVDQASAAALIPILMGAGQRLEESRPYWARTIYDMAATLARAVGTDAEVQAARAAIATSWENEAKAAEPTARIGLLQGAIAAYQAMPGTGETVQRLKGELAQAVAASAKALPMHKFEFSIPAAEVAETIEKLRTALHADRFGLLRLPAHFGMIRDWEKLKADFAGLRKQFPLQYLFGHVAIDADGRMQADPADEAERERILILGHFAQQTQFSAMIGLGYLQELKATGDWSAEAVLEQIGSLDSDIAARCASGIEAFDSGDFWTAVHVLVPQVEHAFRKVAITIDGDVHRLIGTDEVRVATLDRILEDPKVEEVLGRDGTMSLRGLLTDTRGLNVRNITAHGLLDPSRSQAVPAFVALMCILMAVWFRAEILAQQEPAQPPSDMAEATEAVTRPLASD
jgi:hypothetical protein